MPNFYFWRQCSQKSNIDEFGFSEAALWKFDYPQVITLKFQTRSCFHGRLHGKKDRMRQW